MKRCTQRFMVQDMRKMIDINKTCWNCGINKATQLVYGYPICDKCAEEGIDPEEMEEVVIKSFVHKIL